jgi:hypothetical protein
VERGLVANRHDHVNRLAGFQAEELRQGDADDRKRHVVERQRAPDGIGGPGEMALPETVADHGHRALRAAAARIIRVRERAPSQASTPSVEKNDPLA